MASVVYQSGLRKCLDGTIAFLTDTIKMLLLGTAVAYTENQDDDFLSTVTASELSGVSGYTGGFGGGGRKVLASKTIVENDTNNRVEFSCANITWTALGTGGTIDKSIVAKEVTNDAASPMICCLELTNTPTNGGDITLQIASNGFLNINT